MLVLLSERVAVLNAIKVLLFLGCGDFLELSRVTNLSHRSRLLYVPTGKYFMAFDFTKSTSLKGPTPWLYGPVY